MQALTAISKMTSMEIAKATGKRHSDILRDIRDEAEKLQKSGVDTQRKFAFSERKDCTGRKLPYYELTREGVLQLAAKYDAVVRSKLIDLAMKYDQPKQMTAAEILAGQAQLLVSMEQKMEELDTRTHAVEKKIEGLNPKHWKQEMDRKIISLAKDSGMLDVRMRGILYGALEDATGCRLSMRLSNAHDRMKKAGVTHKERRGFTTLDVIASSEVLREKLEGIVADVEGIKGIKGGE